MPVLPDHEAESPPRFSRRALLIGSALNLYATMNDINAMDEVLHLHGFETTICSGNAASERPATRQGILNALDEFTKATLKNDEVVLYYTGHGNITERNELEKGSKDRWRLQYIVPMDFLESKVDDFRGITDYEVSSFLETLSKITHNITLILDCCHSTRLARAGDLMKSVNPEQYPIVFEHIQQMIEKLGINDKKKFFPNGNPYVVRIVAAQTTEPGYEKLYGGVKKSVLTEALVEALRLAAKSPVPVSWNQIMLRVSDRILSVCPQQHPQIEGPYRRICFKTEENRGPGLPVSKVGKEYVLRGGLIQGVVVNDTYAIMPSDVTTVLLDRQIAEAQVISVSAFEAKITISSWEGSWTALPERGAHAILTKKALPKFAVLVHGDDEFRRQVSETLNDSMYVYVGNERDSTSRLAVVNKEESSVTIMDAIGNIIRRWTGTNAESEAIDAAPEVLESLAKAQHVVGLRGSPDTEWPNKDVSVEFGLVDKAEKRPFTKPGQPVMEEQGVYFAITNNGTQMLFVSVLDICLDFVTLVTNSPPTGIVVSPGRTEMIGATIQNTLTGQVVSWPPDVPKDKPILVTVVLVFTDRATDLQQLETKSSLPGGMTIRKGDEPILANLVDRIACGTNLLMSKIMAKTATDAVFGTRTYQYELVPREQEPDSNPEL